jgi:hypothetical protein
MGRRSWRSGYDIDIGLVRLSMRVGRTIRPRREVDYTDVTELTIPVCCPDLRLGPNFTLGSVDSMHFFDHHGVVGSEFTAALELLGDDLGSPYC